jgi:hypothetical protein
MMGERRTTDGLAIVTTAGRAACIAQRCQAARLPARVLAVQEGPTWPVLRPPALLDTIGLAVEVLVRLLVHAPPAPLIALADPDAWRTLRLLALCPSVRLISADDIAPLHVWVRHLASMFPARSTPPAVWLIPAPPSLPLDPLVLSILAAIMASPSYTMAAAQCHVSESTIYRVLRATRTTLKLPHGAVAHYRPAELATLILDRLGADAPGIDDLPSRSRSVLR